MPEKIKKEDLLKEMADVKSLMSHLEDEYREANISEKYYQELREKYSQKLKELEDKLGLKKEKEEIGKKEVKPVEVEKPEVEEVTKGKKPKIGILGRLIGRKENPPETKPEKVEKEKGKKSKEKKELEVGEIEEMTPEVIEKLAQQVAEESGATGAKTEVEETREEIPVERIETVPSIEIEKLKVMIDGIRDAKRVTDETIQTLSENIGEIRSMVFQVDGSLRETSLKLEKIEDDILGLKPKEIDKKFREVNATLEKQHMLIEKFDKKSEDLAGKINEVYKILKGIGGIENLVNLNKDIQKKIEDMKEALKYTERLAFKTEKTFIDLSKSLEDFVVYKKKQDDLEEIVRDLQKSVDELNLKFDNFPTKRDLEMLKGDILVIQKQIEEINKVLPVVQSRLPETIVNLRKEKENILLFLDSLEQQLKVGAISIGEYEDAKKKNLNKLAKIESNLKEEWERVEELIKKGEIPKEKETVKVVEMEKKETKEEMVRKKATPKEIDRKEQVLKEVEIKPRESEIQKGTKKEREEIVDIIKKIKEKIK